jgi:L-asparagine transporter-like permease
MQTKFIRVFPVTLFCVIVGHFGLVLSQIIPGDLLPAIFVEGFITFIFVIGIFIILPGLKKDAENFALRFIGLTTMQMLSMLILIAILIFGNWPDPSYWAFTSISIFVVLLAIQSLLFVQEVNRQKTLP